MGDGFRVRVRAKGWLGFTYYGPKLLKLRLRSGGGFGKKQNRADNQSKSPKFIPCTDIFSFKTRQIGTFLPYFFRKNVVWSFRFMIEKHCHTENVKSMNTVFSNN